MLSIRISILFVIAAILGTILFWLAAYSWLDMPISTFVEKAKAVLLDKPKNVISTQDALNLGRLIEKGIVIEGNDVLSRVSDFYTTIITLLITIITILGITIPLYIKTNAETVAKQQAKQEVKSYFSENISYHSHLETALKRSEPEIRRMLSSDIQELSSSYDEQISDILAVIENYSKLAELSKNLDVEEILGLSAKIKTIEKYIQQMDPVEREASQGRVGEL
ncbi:hypothetical protein C9J22_13275 [Photobacterium phosphoreum]|uniref:hypothetical protein n=1 Tax=Photobacterium phosphoreum TaxID=659 RepID=UPI000D1562CD|nr:hypothetical protein [Photobacterium phosphoreum]PSU69844.1 hypothetical protein C9J22_13275 [Photobacterium phosphoreum]